MPRILIQHGGGGGEDRGVRVRGKVGGLPAEFMDVVTVGGATCVPSFLSSESPEINVLHGNNLLPAEKRKINIKEMFNCGFGFLSLSNIGTGVPLPLK